MLLTILLILNVVCIPLDIYNINHATDNGHFLDSSEWAWFTLGMNIVAIIALSLALIL